MKTSHVAALLSLALLSPAALWAAATPADRQVEASIKDSYTYRTVLDHDVKVAVDHGVVTLSGTVRDDEQRRLAESTAAEFAGVTRVVNQLEIKGGGAEAGSDDWIALKVRSRLLVKANVSLATTKVEVHDGVVSLTGTAKNTAQKELTEEYVKDIEGVRSVKNNIEVVDPTAPVPDAPAEKIDDSSITAQVKYELFSHRSTSALRTKVNTHGGHVVISGDAGSAAEKDLVTKLAQSVRGVESVDNNMTVRP